MRNKKREVLKTQILIILLITSVVQIGIHWNMQTQGLPFPLISQIFNSNGIKNQKMDVDLFKEQYFRPERIIISVSTTHFRLYESDTQYDKVWHDIRDNYIPELIKKKPDKILPKDQWEAITGSRCVRVDFDINWPSSIVYLLEKTRPGENKYFDGIKTIIIMPKADVNETINTVYIYDENQLYQYSIDIAKDFLPKKYYSDLEKISQDKPGLKLLSTVSNFTSDKDIFVSLDKNKGREFSAVDVQIPESIILTRYNIENDIIQENILLNQKESFAANYLPEIDYAMFTDTENLYRLYDNGVLEYKYIPANNSAAGDISVAFKHAATFIEQRRHLIGSAEISLTEINNHDNYYEMKFTYKTEGVPIYYSTGNEEPISHPIIIKANDKRIIECKWAIRFFGVSKRKQQYNVHFADLLNNQIVSTYPEILKSKDISFQRFEPGYIFYLSDINDSMISPAWVISTEERDYFIPLLEKGG
jgi:hypothetical protein